MNGVPIVEAAATLALTWPSSPGARGGTRVNDGSDAIACTNGAREPPSATTTRHRSSASRCNASRTTRSSSSFFARVMVATVTSCRRTLAADAKDMPTGRRYGRARVPAAQAGGLCHRVVFRYFGALDGRLPAGAAVGACTGAGTVSVRLYRASAVLSVDALAITAFKSAIVFGVCAFNSVYARIVGSAGDIPAINPFFAVVSFAARVSLLP